MQRLLRCLLAATALAPLASAQLQTILFTGRFPFVSLDTANERPGGQITQLAEFDFSHVLPLPGAAAARSLLPTTALQCYLGDGNGDGNYTKFANNWKTYFQQIGIGGVFVKAADRSAVTWDKIWFTIRRNQFNTGASGPGALQIEVLTNNATQPYTLVPGDWVRLLPNGNVEFFMTAAQLATATGLQPGIGGIGAGALLQAANGDLYYAPVDGGHWVSGNSPGTAQNAQDGALLKIDAVNITYDANGNVQGFAPNSARLLINESVAPLGSTLHVRQMVLNSGAMDRTGVPIVVAGIYGKSGGLAFDPNGGTWTPVYPDVSGAFPPEPNLLWSSEAGGYGGTLFSTANNGSVATINGVLCGSTTPGVPADGAWLGVRLDIPNFQPSLLSFTLCDAIFTPPMSIDQGNFGSLPVAAAQPTWDVDIGGSPGTPVAVFLDLGPTAPGGVALAVPRSLVPLPWTADSFSDIFLLFNLVQLGVTLVDPFGFGTISIPNPNSGGFTGITLMAQGVGLVGGQLQLSTPMLVQMQ